MNSKITMIIGASVGTVAAIIILVLVMMGQNNYDQVFNPNPEAANMMHRCNNIQQYYEEIGSNIDIKCEKLVHALIN
jgi:hypothetical protein